jgi:hypothetical protein
VGKSKEAGSRMGAVRGQGEGSQECFQRCEVSRDPYIVIAWVVRMKLKRVDFMSFILPSILKNPTTKAPEFNDKNTGQPQIEPSIK